MGLEPMLIPAWKAGAVAAVPSPHKIDDKIDEILFSPHQFSRTEGWDRTNLQELKGSRVYHVIHISIRLGADSGARTHDILLGKQTFYH